MGDIALNDEQNALCLADFPHQSTDRVRYADLDRQGHVNNAVFATFLETGRVELLCGGEVPLAHAGTAFVIVQLHLDFRAELLWPGDVAIGTAVDTVGRSSIRLRQQLFQQGQCAAIASTVIVLVDTATRRSTPLAPETAARLGQLAAEPNERLRP